MILLKLELVSCIHLFNDISPTQTIALLYAAPSLILHFIYHLMQRRFDVTLRVYPRNMEHTEVLLLGSQMVKSRQNAIEIFEGCDIILALNRLRDMRYVYLTSQGHHVSSFYRNIEQSLFSILSLVAYLLDISDCDHRQTKNQKIKVCRLIFTIALNFQRQHTSHLFKYFTNFSSFAEKPRPIAQ